MKPKYLTAFIPILLCSCAYYGRPKITVINDSGVAIRDVVLAGNGFSETIAVIPYGESLEVTVNPKGESDLSIQFRSGPTTISKKDLGYFENTGRYRIAITVHKGNVVTVDTKVGAPW